jgi:cell division septation protein DedD
MTGGDESFHDIQLSGKQVVFLCMASTLVAVVVFLCGVLVGRGVSAAKADSAAAIRADTGTEEATAGQGSPPPGEPGAAATGAETGAFTYPQLTQGNAAIAGKLPSSPPADPPRPVEEEAPPATPVASAPAPATPGEAAVTAATRPGGFTVQVAALRNRGQADTLVARLTAKGFPGFVVAPDESAPVRIFRVRVGPYPDRREAERVARRLEVEEQFKSIITR